MTAADWLGTPVDTPVYIDSGVWERFAAKVVMLPSPGCHLWLGSLRDDGYAQISTKRGILRPAAPGPPLPVDEPVSVATDKPAAAGGRDEKLWRAHRLAYCALTGLVLAEEDHLRHRCDEPLCVPITATQLKAHIEPGDNAANVDDRERRGRGVRRGRWGFTAPTRADRRGQAKRSRDLRQALLAALDDGAQREDLPAVVEAVAAAGDPNADQPTLFDIEEDGT